MAISFAFQKRVTGTLLRAQRAATGLVVVGRLVLHQRDVRHAEVDA